MKTHDQVTEPPAGDEGDVDNSAESRWDELRRRLDASYSVLERRFEPSPEEKSAILKNRAAALAREADVKEGDESQLAVVEFLLANEKYGVEPKFIRDIFPLKTLTPIPCTPPFVLGVTNLRGEVLPVLDLKIFFDLRGEGLTNLSKVIVIESESMEFGILADSVVGSRAVLEVEIQPVPSTFTGVREQYLKGVTEDRLAILDAAEILSDEGIVVHETVSG